MLLLQETWLTSGNIDRLADINDNFMYHGVSGIDNSKILCGRPYGGVAILWKKEYTNCVNKVEICRRACGITITCGETKLLIINCYMPVDNYSCSTVSEEFMDVLDLIECTISKYPSYHVLLGGDINVDLYRNNAHARHYIDFLQRNNMSDCQDWPVTNIEFTYRDLHNGSYTNIDHFAASLELVCFVNECGTYDSGINPSNHRPVFLQLKMSVSSIQLKDNCKYNPSHRSIEWHMVRDNKQLIHSYQSEINTKLNNLPLPDVFYCQDVLCGDHSHRQQINQWCDDLIDVCLQSDFVFPRKHNNKHKKPGWNDNVKPFKDESVFWFNVWSEAGRPGCGLLYDNMRGGQAPVHVLSATKQEKNYSKSYGKYDPVFIKGQI